MNSLYYSHVKLWFNYLNSLILNPFSFKSVPVREKILLIQSNHDLLCTQHTASPKAAMLLVVVVTALHCWGEDSAEECLRHRQDASHYRGSTRSSILKRISPVEKILSDGTKELIEMYDCYRQNWFHLFEYLKNPMFFCLNMLENWLQTIFIAKWS